MYTDTFTYSTRPYPRPWPFVLDGFWKPPFLPIFWVYAAVSLYKAYTTVRHRQFKLHRRWIIRLNALLLGVTVSRPILVFLAVIYVGNSRTLEASRDLLTAVWPISGTTLDRKTLTLAGDPSGTLFGRACSVTLSWPKYGSQLNHISVWEL